MQRQRSVTEPRTPRVSLVCWETTRSGSWREAPVRCPQRRYGCQGESGQQNGERTKQQDRKPWPWLLWPGQRATVIGGLKRQRRAAWSFAWQQQGIAVDLSRREQPRPDEAMPHYRADDAQSRPCKGQCEHHKQIRDDQARIHNERGIPANQADPGAGDPHSSSPSPRPIANADRTSHLGPPRRIAASSLRSGHRVFKYNRDPLHFRRLSRRWSHRDGRLGCGNAP